MMLTRIMDCLLSSARNEPHFINRWELGHFYEKVWPRAPDWSENLGKGAVDWVHRGQGPASPAPVLQPKAELDNRFFDVWISQTYFKDIFVHWSPWSSFWFFSTKFRSLALTKALTKELSELEAVFFWGLEEFVLGPKFGTAELLAIIAMNPIWNIFILGVPKLLIYAETVEWTIN